MQEIERVSKDLVIQQGITEDLYNRFIAYIDAKPKTIQTYTRALKQFFSYTQQHNISTPTREDVIAYRDSLKATCKPTTVQNYIIALRQFFKWTEQEGFYKNVAENIKGAKLNKDHKKDYLSGKQVKAVLDDISKEGELGKRDYAIVSLMVTGGLRAIEIVRANVEDLRTLGDTAVLYIQGKGRDEKTDYVKLPHPVEQAMRAYLKGRQGMKGSDPLFTSTSNNNRGGRVTTRTISGLVKGRLIGAGYDSERLTAHSLRHTAATLNLLNGGSLEETQQLLRHSNLNTTMIYVHNMNRAKNESENRIANAIF
ncbi:MAG: integrase [Spirochaetia bacterium]|nr:integrase [Spirochaetia bacterium]